MSEQTMAVVAPMTLTRIQSPRSYAHPGSLGRRATASLSPSSAAAVGRSMSASNTITASRPLTSLEDIAARLDELNNPSAAFLETSKPYGVETNNAFTFIPHRSRSLPTNYFNSSTSKSSISSKIPLRKAKSVRFADTQGLPLAAVHQLTNKDSSYTANKIVPYHEDELLSSSPLILDGTHVNEKLHGFSEDLSTSMDKNLEVELPQSFILRQNSSTHKRTFTFTQPSLDPEFMERIKKETVVLESIREEPRSLHGIVRVLNLSYEKEVVIRWTHDNWRTSHDTYAVFCTNDGTTDRFAFELPINGDDVSFAIRYRVLGTNYWDSNNGRNYTMLSGPGS